MDELFLRCTRGADKPNIILFDRLLYKFYWASLQAIQRIITDAAHSKQGAGFAQSRFHRRAGVLRGQSGKFLPRMATC